MGRIGKWVAWGAVGLVAVVGAATLGGVAYVELTWDRDYGDVAPPAIHASSDPAVIAAGEYLVHAVAHCQACHQADVYAREHALDPDPTALTGGWRAESGPFGTYYPPNLTPDPETGLGAVPDELVARTIRHGVKRDGKLSITMAMVGPMSDEDLTAIVSYLRAIPPRRNPLPPSEPSFLTRALSGLFAPHHEEPPPYLPAGGVSVERGRYLANGPAGCHVCHTALDLSTFQPGPDRFAGEPMGEPDPTDPAYVISAPNLTPDPETGVMAAWSEDAFVQRFRAGRVFAGSKMPWANFAKLTDDDLRSLYRYLRSLPPVRKEIGPSRRPA